MSRAESSHQESDVTLNISEDTQTLREMLERDKRTSSNEDDNQLAAMLVQANEDGTVRAYLDSRRTT